ncbi:MAG: BolA family transcriptional regulator [Deltaproteobacteria bacterium]|nr:BolA family transcriptional regulator [Deltaproteobacteria bacterium]
MSTTELERRLAAAFPGARVKVQDLTGTSDHFAATIVAEAFAGKLPLARHRMVYAALGESMKQEIHALTLTTLAPGETNA